MHKIWIDMKNPHEPNFFRYMIDFLYKKGYRFVITVRGNTEVPRLLSDYCTAFTTIGKHTEKGMLNKLYFFVIRDIELLMRAPQFDVGMNFISANAIQVAKMRRKPVITFTDNDLDTYWNRLSLRYADHIIAPIYIKKSDLVRQGARVNSIIHFDGFKEEIYAADFVSRKDVYSLPEEFIVIRPEAMRAEYIDKKSGSIAYDLIDSCVREGLRVVYLPRYKNDHVIKRGLPHVFVPENPLNGLELCWQATAVLSGSGSMTREAAILGVPAVSFYPGEKLLAVDRAMIEQDRIFHSRNARDIMKYIKSAKRRSFDQENCVKVRDEVFSLIAGILKKLEINDS
jgi:predicted glycosyltransferase